jgi:peroxiredoxin
MKILFYICGVVFLLGLVYPSIAAEQAESFTLRDNSGNLVRADDFYGKKVVVLDFWATWCKPCVKSMPALQKIYEEFKDKGLVVFGINQDGPRSLAKVEPFARVNGLTFPILLDEKGDVGRKFQVAGLPTTILISKDRKIVSSMLGYRSGDEKALREQIQSLLEMDDR